MGTVERSVKTRGSCRAILGSDGFPSESCFGTTGPNGARQIARLFRIDARLMYGSIRDPMATPRALEGPVGTQRSPGGIVRLRFTAEPPRFGRPATPIGAAEATCILSLRS